MDILLCLDSLPVLTLHICYCLGVPLVQKLGNITIFPLSSCIDFPLQTVQRFIVHIMGL